MRSNISNIANISRQFQFMALLQVVGIQKRSKEKSRSERKFAGASLQVTEPTAIDYNRLQPDYEAGWGGMTWSIWLQ